MNEEHELKSEQMDVFKTIRITTEYAYRITCEKQYERYNEWQFPAFALYQLINFLSDKRKKTDLVFYRIFDWIRIVHWNTLAGYSGAYDSIARELRFLIEDVVQSIYIEQKMGAVQGEAKVQAHSILDDF